MPSPRTRSYRSGSTDHATGRICSVCRNLDAKNDHRSGHLQNNRGLNVQPRIALPKPSGQHGCCFCALLFDGIVAALAELAEDHNIPHICEFRTRDSYMVACMDGTRTH